MRKGLIRLSMGVAFLTLLICATASAQDFQKSYTLAADGRINITNVSGDVIVSGYDGNTIKVSRVELNNPPMTTVANGV